MRFYSDFWKSYFSFEMRDKTVKDCQVNKLFSTELYEGSEGREFTFLPSRTIEFMNDSILSLYNDISILDSVSEICSEVYFSSRIEGSAITYERSVELYNGDSVDYYNYFSEMMVKGGFNAFDFLNSKGNILTEDILVEMWNILVDGCCNNEDIRGSRYRIGEVQVGNHTGVFSGILSDVMKYWIDYYNSDKLNDYPFIKACLLHVSYEMIHPFCDGNGRSGRLLMLNYLIGQGYDKFKSIGISKGVFDHLQSYYCSLELSDNVYSDCTSFIEFMLNIIDNTLNRIKYK